MSAPSAGSAKSIASKRPRRPVARDLLGPARSRPGRVYLAGSGGEGRDMVRAKFVSRGRLGGARLERHAQIGTGPGAGKGAGPSDVGGRSGRDQT